MDITWDDLIKASGGHSVGGQVIALLPNEGNVKLAERTGQTFALTDRGEQFVKDMEAQLEAAKVAAAKAEADAEAAKAEAAKTAPPAPPKQPAK